MRRALYFSLQRAIGSRIGPVWREFLAWEQFTPEQLRRAVDEKLSGLLEAATRSSEYYRRLNLPRRPDETAVDWLRRFPVLTRAQVRAHFAEIVADPLRAEITSPDSVSRKRYDWLVVKTGGSTGIPTTVVHDAGGRDSGRATRLYAARQCGFPLGTPYFRLWGSEQDLLNQEIALPQRILRALLGEIPMNAFKAKKADLLRHLETMRAHAEIEHLMTYVDAAAGLAQFIQDEKLPRPRFKTIMACAGTVTPEFRQMLQETFSAEVFDKYGSRECSDLACECNRHHGLHVFAPHAHLEIVDAAGRECSPGETGRILVTLLNNPGFPMVRYEIGDVAIPAPAGPCPCGSPFPRIQSLQGRQDDMLITEDGTLQSSVFVRHFVGVSLNRQIIGEWQLEQTARNHFIFRYLALRQDGLAENLARLQDSFQRVFGRSAEIEMLPVTELPPSPSGKIRWIINQCGKSTV
jgi:phenylacetate-coenzyme A ligase PaaK-like adenylate-forming protein